MSYRCRHALLLLGLFLLPLAANASTLKPSPSLSIELDRFSGLKSLFRRISNGSGEDADCSNNSLRYFNGHQQQLDTERTRRISQWQEFQLLATSVLGIPPGSHPLTLKRACAAFLNNATIIVNVPRGAMKMDRFVERMLMLGYTAKEIRDVISGRITLHALKQAQSMRALGYSRETINAYLERHYSGGPGATSRRAIFQRPSSVRARLESLVARYARRYNVDPNLVAAIITNESSWRTRAKSQAGAVGLMQLMPTTAKMLGVDPLNPEQNIEGGVRYLAGLMKMFEGDVDAALVAYNAGPAHAQKWRRGDAVLYGETRTYLQRVKSSYTRRPL